MPIFMNKMDYRKWNLANPYDMSNNSWDALTKFARERQAAGASVGDQSQGITDTVAIGKHSASIVGGDGDWSGANFYTKTANTPNGHGSRLYRKADGTIGEAFYKLEEGFPVEAAMILAAPFAVAAMGAGAAAGAGAAEGAAAGAGAAGAGSAATGAGYLAAADAAGGLLPAYGSSSAYAAGLGGAGLSAEYLAAADMAGGLTPEFGTSATYSAGVGGSSNALSGLLSKAGDKMASMGITDWINAAGTVANAWGANKAAGAQVDASRDAIAESRRQYDITRGDQLALLARQEAMQKPWYDAGKNALTQLSSGNFDVTKDPSYQFRMDQGMKALQNSAAARGGLLSGASMKGIQDYSQGLASTEYGNAWNRLASLAGVGQTAANNINQAGSSAYGTIANAGANSSAGIQNSMIGAGNARASGYVGGVNAINQGVGQWYNNTQTNRLLDLYAQKNGLIG